MANALTSALSILKHTDSHHAHLVAWLGGSAVPEGYWPTGDTDAFRAALREHAVVGLDLHGASLGRYMADLVLDPVAVESYTVSDDEGESITVETRGIDSADRHRHAVAQAVAWARKGEYYLEDRTVWVDVDLTDGDGDEVRITVSIDPKPPRCPDAGGHRWARPHELVGGLEENPGCVGKVGAAGLLIKQVCRYCGIYCHTDTNAQRPDTGEQGYEQLRYSAADDESLAWVESLAEQAE